MCLGSAFAAQQEGQAPRAYQTLVAVDVDGDIFVAEDRTVALKRYKSIFYYESIGENVYDAVAKKTSAPNPQKKLVRSNVGNYYFSGCLTNNVATTGQYQIRITKIAYDFFLDKDFLNYDK